MSGEGDNPNACDLCGAADCTAPGHARDLRSERPTQPELDPGKIVFALAVPHTPWIEARVKSLETLFAQLGHRPQFFRVFDDKAPNWVWSRDLWRWGVECGQKGATHLVQLQDDVRPMPHFWSVLRAMVEANPDHWIGLHANHPVARNLAHIGRRWYRDRWLVGPQWVAPLHGHNALSHAVDWVANAEERGTLTKHQHEHEDVCLGAWHQATNRDVWHPIPAIADVDLTIGSTYEGVEGHIDDHRRPPVLWHDYGLAELQTVDYWRPPSEVERVPGPDVGICTWCGKQPGTCRSAATAACICKACALMAVGAMMGLNMRAGA